MTRSIGIRIGRIVKELVDLGIIKKYTTSGTVYKNLYKNKLHKTLKERILKNEKNKS